MYTSIKEIAETLWIPFCLSMMGFIVRIVRSGVASWQSFISSLFCSAFAGILAHWFLAGSGIDTQIASAVIAMSGYCGGALIDAISQKIVREVNNASHEYLPSLELNKEEENPAYQERTHSKDQEQNNLEE